MATTKKKRTTDQPTWNTISGKMRIYGNTFGEGKKARTSWSVSISHKKQDSEEYDNYYLDVRFAGDAKEPKEDGLQWVNVKNAFLSCYSFEDKKKNVITKPQLIITALEDDDELPY